MVAAGCTTLETPRSAPADTQVPTLAPASTTPVESSEESGIGPAQTSVTFPLDPLPDTPRIGPDNAWALRRIGRVPGRISFSQDMQLLQWITEDEIQILDIEQRSIIAALPREGLVTFSPNGKSGAWAPGDGTVIVRDLTGGTDDLRLEQFSSDCCSGLSFSPNGQMLLVADRDPESVLVNARVFRLIDLQNGMELFAWVDQDSAEFSPDGSTLGLQSSQMIGVTLWDIERLEQLETISGFSTAAPVYAVRFSPDWQSVAFWARAGGELYDVDSGQMRFDFIGEPQTFTPDGQILATSETGWMDSQCTRSVCLYDVESGAIRAILPHTNVIKEPTPCYGRRQCHPLVGPRPGD